MYHMLQKDNMAAVVTDDECILLFLSQQQKLLSAMGVEEKIPYKFMGAVFRLKKNEEKLRHILLPVYFCIVIVVILETQKKKQR